MPWKQTTPMTERRSFLERSQPRLGSMTERCPRGNIRRTTGDTWLRRDVQEGFSGLQEKSRAPLSCPHRLTPDVAAVLWEAKPRHPSWGPRQSRPSLARHRPALELPAASRAGERFRKAGWSRSKPRRRRPPPPGAPALHAGSPHEVWTADCTGPCRPGDGVYGSPLTGADAYSRDRLGCTARLSTTPGEAQPSFARLVHAHGLPAAMRPDKGPPLAPPAFCGLAKLRVWWIKRGLRHQRIAPGRPAQHGRPERRHRTLQAEATRPPARNHATQPARFDRLCRAYNPEPPQEALGQHPPAALDHAAPRRMPAKLAAPEDPGHGLGRRLSNAATCRFPSRQLFLRDTWLQAWVALEETGDGMWSIACYDVRLARLDERDFKLRG